eukprot:Hpha_TRINITY_DN16296_c2_g4::TRINITY_DN16296_c2_g4_i1::g.11352::m.11352
MGDEDTRPEGEDVSRNSSPRQNVGDEGDDSPDALRTKSEVNRQQSFARRRASLSSTAFNARDQEILSDVRDKLRRQEALRKRRDAETSTLHKATAQARRDVSAVTSELQDEQRPAERLKLLERKKICVETLQSAEEAEEESAAAFSKEEAELVFTADEERVYRGIRAESMHRQSMKQLKSDNDVTRRASARDMHQLTQEREEQEEKRLEAAKAKSARQREISLKLAKLEETQRVEMTAIDDSMAAKTKERESESGEEYIRLSQCLVDLHEEKESTVERHAKERAEVEGELAQYDFTPEEEAALRGWEAREKERKARKEMKVEKQSPRQKHAQYSHRGADTIRRVDTQRRLANNRNARELKEAAEGLGRLGIQIGETSELVALTRSAAKELITAQDAPAEERYILAQHLRSAEDQATDDLTLLRAERNRLDQLRKEQDSRADKSMDRARTVSPPSSSFAGSPRRVCGASVRLLHPPRRRELPELDRGPRLGKGRQEEVNHRLHDACMERAKQRQEKLRSEEKQWVTTRPLRRDEEDFLVQRMFYQQREREAALSKQLTEKWRESKGKRKLASEEEKECNERMFYNRRGHRDEVRAMLTQKYISNTNPVFPKLGRTVIEAAVLRLHTPSPG